VRFISYAQNFEDVLLWRALGHIKEGFYVDVGAQHPTVDSVSRAFYERGWRGVHVEPTSKHVELLKSDRPDEKVLQAVVSDHRGQSRFFEVADGGLSTGDEAIARRYRERGIQVRELTVPCVTLDDVLQNIGTREVHWLKIDTEGMEREVLKGWRNTVVRPWILIIESTVPCTSIENWRRWEALVLRKGYRFVYFDGLNRFYVSGRHRMLAKAFRVPPNVFDEFVLDGSASASFCRYVNEKRENERGDFIQRLELLSGEAAQTKHFLEKERDVFKTNKKILEAQIVSQRTELEQARSEWCKRESALQLGLDSTRAELLEQIRNATDRERTLSSAAFNAVAQASNRAQANLEQMLKQEQATIDRLDNFRFELREQREQIEKEHRMLETKFREELTRAERDAAMRIEALHLEMAHRDEEVRRVVEATDKAAGAMRSLLHESEEREEAARRRADTLQNELIVQMQQARVEAEEREQEKEKLLQASYEERTALLENLRDFENRLEAARAVESNLRKEIATKSLEARELALEIQQLKRSVAWKAFVPARWLETAVAHLAHRGSHSPSHGEGGKGSASRGQEIKGNAEPPSRDGTASRKGGIESVGELLALEGQEFVHGVYRSILKREPDAGGLAETGRRRNCWGPPGFSSSGCAEFVGGHLHGWPAFRTGPSSDREAYYRGRTSGWWPHSP